MSHAHADVVPVLLGLVVMLVAAKLAGDLATRGGQPAVFGELLAGVLLGNLTLVGFHGLAAVEASPGIELLAQLGVIVLLFQVGLGSTVGEMLSVGVSSLSVAFLGVATPFALGWLAGAVLLPGHSVYAHVFLGAALTATSVGITARVLQDLGRSRTREAKIILGAAVIDDVLGLMILAVVGGLIAAADSGSSLSIGAIAVILAKAALFLVTALVVGPRLSPRLFRLASRLRAGGLLLATSLAFCFLLSYLASRIGLAPIVGAFAAGLILEEVQYKDLRDRGEHQLEESVQPIAELLVPVFFVLMGMRVELTTFGDPRVLGLAAAITLAAIVGKQACAFGPFEKGLDRLSIGIGMIPRGEVGLIFASIGATLVVAGERIVDPGTYSAIVIMVIVTTMAAPPALKWSLTRTRRAR